jgi:hypothetical protein
MRKAIRPPNISNKPKVVIGETICVIKIIDISNPPLAIPKIREKIAFFSKVIVETFFNYKFF